MASGNSSAGGSPYPTEGLQMRALNVESASDRFSFDEDSAFPPQTAKWRNNLAASSQRRNVLFAAYNDKIYVWAPSAVSQALGTKPEMIITPVYRRSRGGGYISSNCPHAINNLLLGDLGLEEVLLAATDSGNVCGYRVEAIFSALERAARDGIARPVDGPEIDPFLLEFVEDSAWGLAIHKYARLIAVSANTGNITVFAFALVDPEERNLDPDRPVETTNFTDNDQKWLHIHTRTKWLWLRDTMPNGYRKRNVKITYTGHFANIPCVSFFSSVDDPNGVWMISTDIENRVMVWKIWESLSPVKVFKSNDMNFAYRPHNNDLGWAVFPIEPRSIRHVATAEEACGGTPQHRVKAEGQSYLDITGLTYAVPDASHLYRWFPPDRKVELEQPCFPDIFDPDCRTSSREVSDTPIPTGDGVADPQTDSVAEDLASDSEVDTSDGLASHDDSLDPDMDAESQDNSDAQVTSSQGNTFFDIAPTLNGPDLQTDPATLPPAPQTMTPTQFLQLALVEALGGGEYFDDEQYDGSDIFDEDMDDVLTQGEDPQEPPMDMENNPDYAVPSAGVPAYHIFESMYRAAFPGSTDPFGPLEKLISHGNPPACPPPIFPILQFSLTDIRLIPSPFATHPSVFCGSPLRQPSTHRILDLQGSDRFNMVQYIPEQGLVIAASMKGRAAVISLTESKETGVAFRIDWIVPFESQEKYGERPLKTLLGMSVSPIQGFEIPADPPYLPRDITYDCILDFHFDLVSRDEPDNYPASSSDSNQEPTETTRLPIDPEDKTTPKYRRPMQSVPERHAWKNQIWRPDEPWRAWYPSRRYRLVMLYSDHTVMTYEFWYDQRPKGKGEDEMEDDPYFEV